MTDEMSLEAFHAKQPVA